MTRTSAEANSNTQNDCQPQGVHTLITQDDNRGQRQRETLRCDTHGLRVHPKVTRKSTSGLLLFLNGEDPSELGPSAAVPGRREGTGDLSHGRRTHRYQAVTGTPALHRRQLWVWQGGCCRAVAPEFTTMRH